MDNVVYTRTEIPDTERTQIHALTNGVKLICYGDNEAPIHVGFGTYINIDHTD